MLKVLLLILVSFVVCSKVCSDEITEEVYYWDFGDGNFKQGADVLHDYDSPGIYETKVALMREGKIVSIKKKIIDMVSPFIEDVVVDVRTDGLNVNFSAEGKYIGESLDLSFQWVIDESATLLGSDVSYQFREYGSHSVALKAMFEDHVVFQKDNIGFEVEEVDGVEEVESDDAASEDVEKADDNRGKTSGGGGIDTYVLFFMLSLFSFRVWRKRLDQRRCFSS